MSRHPSARITRKDWTGDAVLALVFGVACVVALFLPWANEQTAGSFNPALTHPASIKGILATQWGPPALGLSVIAAAAPVAMFLLGPRRLGIVLGLLTAAAGGGMVAIAVDAINHAYWPPTQAGLGALVALVSGIMLVPIGLAAAAVALVLAYLQPRYLGAPPT